MTGALSTLDSYGVFPGNRVAFVTEPTGHLIASFVLDKKAGQTNGEGNVAFGAKWYAVSAKGTAIVKASTTTTTGTTTTTCRYPPC